MKILLSWMREYTDTKLSAAELAEALTMAGLAVEGTDTGADGDCVLDVAVTTNRPDCMSHYGIAREAAALTGARLDPLNAPTEGGGNGVSVARVGVTIETPRECGLYCARVFENVPVGPSKPEIASRLERLGHRAINNVADFTNYTLQAMGHPTHAFDADKLRGDRIIVRYARAGEKLTTLDGEPRTLAPEDLVIADQEKPVALAGVMGGLESSITTSTRRVVLESAWFHPAAVRRTAKRHGLRTEASFRFERGADAAAAITAAALIAAAVVETGAKLSGGTNARGELPAREAVILRAETLRRLLGIPVDDTVVRRILAVLGFEAVGSGRWMPPTWRPDVSQEADLVEEVARLYGYDKFPARVPKFAGWSQASPRSQPRARIRRQLSDHGFAETLTLSFASEAECKLFAPLSHPVRVLNPLSEEAAILRTSSLPAMLHQLRNNQNRGNENSKLFEIGKIYVAEGSKAHETAVLALGACGAALPPNWGGTSRPYDFFDLKGELEAVFDHFQLGAVEYAAPQPASEAPGFHLGRSAVARLDGRVLAIFGQLASDTTDAWKLPEETCVGEVDLEALYKGGARLVDYSPPSRFPSSERDFSFLLRDETGWLQVSTLLSNPPIEGLRALQPIELFRGAKLPEGHYSLLFRARFQRDDRTLRDEEVHAMAEEIVRRMTRVGTQR